MMKNTLIDFLKIYGPSGLEQDVAAHALSLLEGKFDTMRTDAMGNLILTKKGQEGGKRILMSAHMDHIGLIVTDIEEEGFLRVTNVGGVSVKNADGRHVVFQNGTNGICMSQPVKQGEPKMGDLFIDIGVKSKEEALRYVQLGDVCVYAPDIFELGEHQVVGPAMDDRSACAVLAELFLALDNPRNTVIGVFSTQEEVGIRGAMTAAYAENPDIGVGIDVTAWGDTPETKVPCVKLGEGAAVKIMDRSMVATPTVRDAMFKAAEIAGVPAQSEILPFGGTDGAAIQRTRGGVPTGTLSIPCRYVHSATEVVDLRDLEGAVKLLKAFADLQF